MACSKLTFPCDLPQIEREVSVVREREAIPHFIEPESCVVADSNPGMHGGRAACHAVLVLHFRLQYLDLPKRSGQSSEGARLAATEAGNCVRPSSQRNSLCESVTERRWLSADLEFATSSARSGRASAFAAPLT